MKKRDTFCKSLEYAQNSYLNYRNTRNELAYYNKFLTFYQSLKNNKNIFYMFFTTGMLHWAKKSLSLIPPSVNLVLICAGLEEEELSWVRENVQRPLFITQRYFDHNTIWEFLMKVNQNNYGWIDIDCFVFNERLFEELVQIDDEVAINCVWTTTFKRSYNHENKDFNDLDMLKTYLLFINVDVYKSLQNQGIDTSFCSYTNRLSGAGRSSATKRGNKSVKAFSKVLKRKHLKLLNKILPKDSSGSLIVPKVFFENEQITFFDTLILYQFIAQASGYKIHKVRHLKTFHSLEEYFSNEVIHVGDISWYKSVSFIDKDPNFNNPKYDFFYLATKTRYQFILLMDYVVLSSGLKGLPKTYSVLLRTLVAKIQKHLQIPPDQALYRLSQFLLSVGVNQEAIDIICEGGHDI